MTLWRHIGRSLITVIRRGAATARKASSPAGYHWVGHLLHGNELWCDVNGMEVSGSTRPA
jgi:hypothetical protein